MSDPSSLVNGNTRPLMQTITGPQWLAVLFVVVLVAGCATDSPVAPSQQPRPERESSVRDADVDADIQALLARAGKSTPPRSIELTLDAVAQAIDAGSFDQAAAILDRVDASSSRTLHRRALYLEAELELSRRNPTAALRILERPELLSGTLTRDDQIRIGRIRARAYFMGRSYLASARERIFIHGLLDDDGKDNNHEQIFATLMEMPASSLTRQAEKAITSDIRGWLSLASLAKRNQGDPLEQLIALNRWKKAWPHHPAASRMPSSLKLLSKVVAERPEAIAILLPLHGELAPFGRAIRDGLMAAHLETNTEPHLRIYDTSRKSMEELLNIAERDGAELVIGPLDRERVTTITHMDSLPFPVLALNRSLDGNVNANVYQFGLSPEDEVVQVARQVRAEGKSNALVLYADSDWGHRNFDTFRQTWNDLGGNLVDSAGFDANERDYSELVKSLLDVDESEARASELRRITGERFEFTPRRRQDIDFVFLLADPSQARRLNPTLAFFYADDVPVYATSHVHEYTDSKIDAIDLNGIRFCDIPWKLTNTDQLQQNIQDTWTASREALAPFYALGVDAYRLYPRLQQLKQLPDARLFGTTGVLQLNEENVITRELMWARFVDGSPVTAPMVMEITGR